MKIRIPRNSLSDTLDTFGKMLAAKDMIAIRSDGRNAVLAGQNHEAKLSMTPEAATATDSGACSVSFGAFKSATDATEAKEIGLETQGNSMAVLGDGRRIASLPVHPDIPHPAPILKEAESTPLPTGFASFLMQAFQSAGSVPEWKNLDGVHVSARGVAASDGHQLTSIPLPSIKLQGDVTMPPSPLYQALRRRRWSSLSIWDDKSGKRRFAIQGDSFLLMMDALEGLYPQYWSILPDRRTLDVKAVLSADAGRAAIDFLKEVPEKDNEETEIWMLPDRLELRDQKGRRLEIPAACNGVKLPHGLRSNAKYLLQALRLGHTVFQSCSKSQGVILATGGSGLYAWMPLRSTPEPYKRNANAASPTARQNDIQTSNQTTRQKENHDMTQPTPIPSQSIPPAAHSPLKPQEQPQTSTSADPLSELSATITAMREHLDELQARLLEAGRKLRKAAAMQRNKQRFYQDTQKLIKRIHMAG